MERLLRMLSLWSLAARFLLRIHLTGLIRRPRLDETAFVPDLGRASAVLSFWRPLSAARPPRAGAFGRHLLSPVSRPGSSPADEASQVRRAKNGDPQIWDLWFRRFYPPLYRYAYSRLRQRVEAEDLVSQVFIEALNGIRRFRYTGRPVLAWLYRIAHNLAYDRLKTLERDALTEAPVDPEVNYQEGPESLVPRIDLLNSLDELNEEQREVIILRYFFSMSAQDIADVLGKTRAAVFSQHARALVALRRRLGEHTPP